MILKRLIANRYEVIEPLGSGGFSTVLKVKDQHTGDILALKYMSHHTLSDEQKRRFQREFRLLSRLDHPHIVSVKETGTDEDSLFFTMEYLQGFTLDQVLKTPTASLCLALRSGGEIFRKILFQTCDALNYIHAHGLVHRDLKPANIFLQTSAMGPHIKILDLGMVKLKEEGQEAQTEEGVMLGTVHYMSPEQIRGVHVDSRADLYTLGITLYEIMTGRKPFEGKNSASVILKHLNEIPVPPRVYNLDISHDLQLVVLKLLEKEPERRYRSSEDLLADLSGPKTPPDALESRFEAPDILLHPRFLGRNTEIVEARKLFADIQRGNGQILTISGDPGIGKTRFLDELKADAGLQNIPTFSASCFEDRTASYQPIVACFRAVEKSLGQLKAWAKETDITELSRLFPELGALVTQPLPLQQEDRNALFEALFRLLENMTRHTPFVFCIDDGQWADQGTLDFIGYLQKHIENLPICLCIAHRPFQDLAPKWFEKAKKMALPPLKEEGIANLLASLFGTQSLPEDFISEIYGISGGNPFFAIETTKTMIVNQVIVWEKDQWIYKGLNQTLPEQLETLINLRLKRLNETDNHILSYVSVLNRPCSFDLLFDCDFNDEDSFYDQLESLVRRNFLIKNRQDHYTLFHSLIGQAILSHLPLERKKEYHVTISQALKREPELYSKEMAYHLLRADMLQQAVPYLVLTGNQALKTYAYLDAREAYEKALHILDNHNDPAPEIYPDLICNYVETLFFAGNWDDVQKHAEQGLKNQNLTPYHQGLLCINLGWTLSIKGKYFEAEEQFLQALKYNEQLQDKKIQLRSQTSLINIYWQTGQYLKATQFVKATVSLCQKYGDAFHQALGHYLEAHDHLTNCRFAEAETAFQTALIAFETIHRDERYIHMCQSSLREIYTYRGRFEEAEVLSKKTIDACRKMGSINAESYETLDLGYIYAEQNKVEQSEACYFSALDTLLKSNQRQKLPLVYTRLSELYIKKGDFQKALNFATQAKEILGPEPLRRCQVYRALGMVHAALGATEEAASHFDKSIDALKDMSNFQQALSLFESGRFHGVLNNMAHAETQLGKAIEMFQNMGADHFLQKAQLAWQYLESRKTVQSPLFSVSEPSGISTDLFKNLNPHQLLDEAIDRLLKLICADRGLILTVHQGKPRIQTACSRQLDKSSIADISMSVVQTAIEAATLIVTTDAANDPRFQNSHSIAAHHIGSILCMPLKARNGSVIGAVYADNEGAKFFAPKDIECFKYFGEFVAVALENTLHYHKLQEDLTKLAGFRTQFGDLVGTSPAMQQVYDLIERLATTDVTMLLQGETGTGKGLVARTVHNWSNRSDKPFLLQNCGALPRELLESELFGHSKGSFTGASSDRQGLFEAADGGTVFLDEIADAPPEVQVRLLHVLEEGTVRRVGENQMRTVNVRVIAATYCDLEAEVKAKRFREDLYYRLKVMTIAIPPLRERPEDITLLANHFLQFWRNNMGKKVSGLTSEVQKAFLHHKWPGNIRELKNEIQRGVALVEEGGRISIEHLSDAFTPSHAERETPINLKNEVEHYERALIVVALKKNNYHISQTAEKLGLSRQGFQKKLQKYDIAFP